MRRRNCFSAPARSLDLLTTPSPVHNGFWIYTSYLNHACLPNGVRAFLGDVLFLRATRNISEGEEITTQYFAPELMYEERQQIFMNSWAIGATALCTHDKSVGPKLEAERMAIFEELKAIAQKLGGRPTVTALKKFAKRLQDLEVLYADGAYDHFPRLCLVHPTLYIAEAWRTLRNLGKMIEAAAKLLKHFGILFVVEDEEFKVLDNVGLINVETVGALKYMAEGYEAKGRANLANEIRILGRVWFRVITGADVGVEDFMKG